jgi:hypothetical protein
MIDIMEEEDGASAARVAAARLLFDAGYLEDSEAGERPADQATVPELDAEIAKLERGRLA